jgi:hypothetical protein
MKENVIERDTFFGDRELETDLPKANQVFWSSLIGHIEQDFSDPPRVILDIGCHTGGEPRQNRIRVQNGADV